MLPLDIITIHGIIIFYVFNSKSLVERIIIQRVLTDWLISISEFEFLQSLLFCQAAR